MMITINDVVAAARNFVWGPVMLVFLVGTGIFLTVGLRFISWRTLPLAIAMAIPNMVALLGLSGVVFRETKNYFHHGR